MRSSTILGARFRAVSGRPVARLFLAEQLAERGAAKEAIRHFAAAAREGLPEAQARLGLCYLHGHGVPPNLAEARHWLECAANAGNVTAQTMVASLAVRGIAGPYQRGPFQALIPDISDRPNYELAAEMARRAANAGSAEAQALLALILGVAPSIPREPGEVDALYRESSQGGWPLGQLGHAMTLMRDGSPDAMLEAHDLLSAAADAGLATANFLLGTMAEAGVGAERNPEVAVTRYRQGAEHGHTGAKIRLGLALLAGRGTRRNLVEAETWLRRAALDGEAIAAAILGDFYASSDRQPPNLEEAAKWYRHAAELGHPGSAHALARLISAGASGKPDPQETAVWLETAIERGEAAAWPELGSLIASEALPPSQLPALHDWLRRMIREDRPEAGYYVGVCVNSGIGTPVNEPLARRYYLQAAAKGVVDAMVAAAEMLLNGRGGTADAGLALAMFKSAGKRDHAGAIYALGVIAGNDRASAMKHFRRAADLGHSRALLLTARDPVTA